MDLKHNGQYRLMKISEFNFIRKTPDDILLLPTIMEKLNQIKGIISSTLKNLYEALGNKDDQEDLTSYIRAPCTNPSHSCCRINGTLNQQIDAKIHNDAVLLDIEADCNAAVGEVMVIHGETDDYRDTSRKRI
ncbi:hypothetical protein [Parasitella parasitica]|uniref:Uncharacterized protein n=1 Tax=Parasitella parasitica TaxID=35722 RepID=A0A0B7MZT7_9FUNG|nr:hypothetical protein [Parasitella parasitica]